MGTAQVEKPTILKSLRIEPLDGLHLQEGIAFIEEPIFRKFLLLLVGGVEWMIQTAEPYVVDDSILEDLYQKYPKLRAKKVGVCGGGFIRSKPERKIVEVFGTTRMYGFVQKEYRIELKYLLFQRFLSWNIVFIEPYLKVDS